MQAARRHPRDNHHQSEATGSQATLERPFAEQKSVSSGTGRQSGVGRSEAVGKCC